MNPIKVLLRNIAEAVDSWLLFERQVECVHGALCRECEKGKHG